MEYRVIHADIYLDPDKAAWVEVRFAADKGTINEIAKCYPGIFSPFGIGKIDLKTREEVCYIIGCVPLNTIKEIIENEELKEFPAFNILTTLN